MWCHNPHRPHAPTNVYTYMLVPIHVSFPTFSIQFTLTLAAPIYEVESNEIAPSPNTMAMCSFAERRNIYPKWATR